MRVRHRFASDAVPRIEISSAILTVWSHHSAIGRLLDMTEQPGRAGRRNHAHPCVCPPRRLPSPQFGLFPSAGGGAGGGLATRLKSLIPVRTVSLPRASVAPSWISSGRLPRPVLPHACSPTTCSQELRLRGSPRSRCPASTNSQLGQKGPQLSRSYGHRPAGSAAACCFG